MTWTEFVVTYTLSSVPVLWVTVRGLRQHGSGRLLRLVVALLMMTFFVDQAAESRNLWVFPSFQSHRTFAIFDVPIENLFFTVASAAYALTTHLLSRSFFRAKEVQ